MSQKIDETGGERKPSALLWVAALSALFAGMCMGTILGWSSPALPSLEYNSSTPSINGTLSESDKQIKTWIGSSTTIGALVGALLGGTAISFLGMKKTLVILGPPIVVGWILICVAKISALIIVGRVLTGFAVGIGCGVSPTYINQIATPSIRGLLGTGFQMFVNTGILYAYVWGLAFQGFKENQWRWLCIPCMAPPILMSIGMFFMPESPEWLMAKFGRGSQVVDALKRLRSDQSDVETELKELEDRAERTKQEPGFSFSQVKRADVLKPLIISCALMFFQQFSGINAVLFYSKSIFEDAGSSLDPMISTVIIAIVLAVSVVVAAFLIDRFGRKILLLISGVGMCISLAIMGYYYYDKEVIHKVSSDETLTTTISSTLTTLIDASTTATTTTTKSNLGWLPVLALMIYVVMFSIGIGPIPWMMTGEITPSFAIGFISSLATAINWLSAFVVTKEFDDIKEAMHSYGAFWLFSGICAAYTIFTFFFIPESKGKSIEDIQRIFLGSKYVEPTSNGRYGSTSNDISRI